jgi:hypothetical protein
VKPKRRGRPPGSRNKPKIVAIAPAPEVIEEEAPEPPAPASVRAAPVRATRRQAPEEQRQPVYFAPPTYLGTETLAAFFLSISCRLRPRSG